MEDTGIISGPDSGMSDIATTGEDIVKVSETKVSSAVSPAQKIKEQSIPLPYKEPKWNHVPNEAYGFDILKFGQILGSIDLSTKSFYVFGLLSTCDIRMSNTTVSRYHAVLRGSYRKS